MTRLDHLRQRHAIVKHLRAHGTTKCKPGESTTLAITWFSGRASGRISKQHTRALAPKYEHRVDETGNVATNTKNLNGWDAK